MRILKLQMQVSLDGFVGGPGGELDWMEWNWDDELNKYVTTLTESIDNILLGRKLAEEFIPYWTNAAGNSDHPEHAYAHNMVNRQKIVFSNTLTKSPWPNTRLANRNIVDEIDEIKQQKGKDIIVYGGAEFVSNLIKHKLVDEYHLFINPVVIGKGLTIFRQLEENLNLRLIASRSFDCGIVALHYIPES